MLYRQLGDSGLRVSGVTLGCLAFGEVVDEGVSAEIVSAALDAGITTFDTANVYGGGLSEEYLGKALKGRRDSAVIMTKGGFRIGDDPTEHARARAEGYDYAERMRRGIGPNEQGCSRLNLIRSVEGSLRRLGTDYIDVFQLHLWDPHTPVSETLAALSDLVQQGKIRYVGCSTVTAWQLYRMLWVAERDGYQPIVSVQAQYNLLARDVEQDLLEATTAVGVGVLAYKALAGGMLAGRYSRDEPPSPSSHLGSRPLGLARWYNDRTLKVVDALAEISADKGVPMASLATAWLLHQNGVSSVLAGVETSAEVEALALSAEVALSPQELDVLARVTE